MKMLTLLLALAGMAVAGAAEYSVDAERGSDANDGLSAERAWQSLRKANAAKLAPGSTVRFRRGGEFRGQLRTRPGVTYSNYGEGDKPILCRSLACDGKAKWTRPLKGQWHTWRSTVTSAVEVTSVILDEDRGGRWNRCVRKASLGELKKDREFWWDPKSGAVYFQFWCNPSDKYGRIELVQAGDAIVAADGVKIEGLSVRGAGGAAVGGKVRGVTVRNCDFLGVGAGVRLGEACRVERCRFALVSGDVFAGKGLVCRDNVMWEVRRVAANAAALDFAFNTCVTTNTPGVDAQRNLLLKPRHLSNAGWDFAAISRYDFRIVAQGGGRKEHAGARDMPGVGIDQSAPYPVAIPADAKLEVRDADGAKTYPVPGLIRSREWSATVNGVACDVAFGNARFEEWSEQGGPYGIVQFEMTRPVKLEVRTLVGRDLSKVAILPRGAPVKLVGVKDGVISLEVLKPCKFSIDPDEWDRGCFVFANAPMADVPDAKDPKVTVLEPGVHRVKGNVYRMKSGETLYFKPGAVLQGGIDASDAANIRICGNGGYLDGSPWCRDDMPQYCFLHFTRCRDIRLEDIVLRSSWHWTTFPQGCDRMTVRNLKTCGGGNSNDDGIDPSNTRDLTIVDSFFRTQDDCIAVKGIDRRHGPCERMLVTNCVFMTGYARVILLGHESKAEHMRDMRMVDCDVLHYVRPIFLVEPGDDMPIEDVRFENVRAHTDLHPRTEATIRFQPIVNIYTSKTPGHVRDITVDGLHLYGPRIPLKFWISGYDEAHRSAGVTLRNVEINGKPLVWESAARTTDEGVEDVWFDGENHPDRQQRAYGIGHWVDSVTLDSRTGKPVTMRTGKDAKTDVLPAGL